MQYQIRSLSTRHLHIRVTLIWERYHTSSWISSEQVLLLPVIMVLSRSQAQIVFHHVFNNVLGRTKDTPLQKFFIAEGIQDIFALVTINKSDFDKDLYVNVDDGADQKISRGDQRLVQVFLDYVTFRNSSNNPIGDDWTSITQDDFDSYRISPDYAGHQPSPTSKALPTTSSVASASKYSPADLF